MRRHWRRIISWHPVPLCHFPTSGREVTGLRPQWGRSLGEMPSQILVDQWSTNSPCDCSFSAKQLLSQWDRSSRQGPARKFVAHWATITNPTYNFGPLGQNIELCLQWRQSQLFSSHSGAKHNCGPLGHNFTTSCPVGTKCAYLLQLVDHWSISWRLLSHNYSPVGNNYCRFQLLIQWRKSLRVFLLMTERPSAGKGDVQLFRQLLCQWHRSQRSLPIDFWPTGPKVVRSLLRPHWGQS